jgi:hypothetical protein
MKYGVGGLEVQIHCHKERTIMFGGKQEDAELAPGGVGQGGLASQLT